MYELKTKLNSKDVLEFIMKVEHNKRREDSLKILDVFHEVTGEEPKMWGESIVGYGMYHYKYASGQEGDWMRTGFSPRKQALTLYLMNGISSYEELLSKLGKYKTGKGCLYINKLEDVDLEVVKKLIKESFNKVIEQGSQGANEFNVTQDSQLIDMPPLQKKLELPTTKGAYQFSIST